MSGSANVVEQKPAVAFDRRAIPDDAIEGIWTAPDGHAIRRIDWPGAGISRGSVLYLPGRADAYEKYLEALDHWHRLGWRVTAADWRGQAGSGRLGADAVTGHIDDFAVWIDDLAALWREWKARTPAPHVLIGHSMGGHLVLRATAERRVDPDALVLSAPMLGIHPDWVPSSLLNALARGIARLGDPRRPAWRWSEKPGALPADRSDLLTHSQERYADEIWWRAFRPELVMGPGSWGWIEQGLASIRVLERPETLEGVCQPVLILATTRDKLVSWRAIARAARRLPNIEMIRFDAEARHEILREADPIRQRALDAVDGFLDRAAAQVK